MDQNDISILNIYAPQIRVPTFVKEILLKFISYIDTHTLILGNFNTPRTLVIQIKTKQRNNKTNRYNESEGHDRHL